jgi:sigma-E factor negative regulatory protein RseC
MSAEPASGPELLPVGDGPLEAVARIVGFDRGLAILEPEPAASCSGCMSAALCGAGNPSARKRLAKRFTIPAPAGLEVGDRVVVGFRADRLVRASLTAYALPLLTMIVAVVVVDQAGASEGRTMIAALVGLALGFGLARLVAARLSLRGDLSPRFIRRAYGPGAGQGCHTDLG